MSMFHLWVFLSVLGGLGIVLIVVDIAYEVSRDRQRERRDALMERYCFKGVTGTKDQWLS